MLGKLYIFVVEKNPAYSLDQYNNRKRCLLLDVLYLVPLSFEILLPQTDLVVSAAHSKNISGWAPANSPSNGVKLELLAIPLARVRPIRGPNPNGLILRCRGNVRFGENAGRPGNVANPVGVPFQRLGHRVGL